MSTGWFGASSAKKVTDEVKNSPHYEFITSFLLPTTQKLQKELRGRRFKEVQTKLQECVAALTDFQVEAWPPEETDFANVRREEEEAAKTNNSKKSLGSFLGRQQEQQQGETVTVDNDVESTVGDFQDASGNAAAKDFVVVEDPSAPAVAAKDDNPLTRAFVHEAITVSMEAYVLCMMHPNKTNKACDYALQCISKLIQREYFSGRAGGRDDTSGSGSQYRTIPTAEKPEPSLLHRIMEGVSKCSESTQSDIQKLVVRTMKIIMTSPRCGVHEATMLLAIRSVFHIYLVTKSNTCKKMSKLSLMEMLRVIIFKMEDSRQYQSDVWIVFRSLCKLSSKTIPEDGTPTSFLAQQFQAAGDPLALNNKVLSLELILSIFEQAGPALCHGEKFIHLVQSQLCVALMKNCTSNHTQVAFLSQKIFLILVYKFKVHLKEEIEVFLSNIFLRVLESPNASFQQKALVLESLRSLCNDPVLLTQIFLNYDCDFDAMNLYKDIVFHLTKLGGRSTATPSSTISKKEAENNFELSLAGVEVLVAILKAFLKALDLPGGESAEGDDTAGFKMREQLNLVIEPEFDGAKSDDGELEENGLATPVNGKDEPARRSTLKHQTSSQDVAGMIVDAFDRKRTAEQNFELGAVKFTLSIKTGLNFFVDNGFVTLDAKEIANFFLQNKDKLDKTQMGEVLGKEPDGAFVKVEGTDPEKGGPGFFVRILHHYVDAMDFSGLMFDDAIRLFLSGFRLPGEAQKIDRIMEKFAERYTKQNIDVFPSADTAFILAFSVIMLNTDLHNPSIKPERRMTLEGFQRNNRGIGENGGDLPDEFLAGIFERIQKSPFSLKEDDAAREAASAVVESSLFFDTGGSFFGSNSEERKKEKFKKEREEILAATEQLIRNRSKRALAAGAEAARLTEAIDPADVVKPMFDVTWGPMIGILSQVLECSDDERSIKVCLHGFVYAIRLASHSNMSLARDTFVNSLAKFTLLGSIKEMKQKNIESIRTLLNIAVVDGEYLGESWGPVLQCISQLARMRMSASGLDSDESFLQDESEGTATPSKRTSVKPNDAFANPASLFQQPTKADISRETEESNSRAILESVDEVLVDKVFSSTVNLSAMSLAHFIEQLVAVSTSEIAGDSKRGITGVAAPLPSNGTKVGSSHGDGGPSIFSLQRLVDVADYNMDVRPRLAWTQIWGIMADFFSKIGCHKNAMVSVFAIDSLKQLTSKFLEKPELSEYHFQRLFLNPFLLVMQNSGTREDIREMILQCVDNIIRTKCHNLRSGWKVLFNIIIASASDASEKITFVGLSILQRLLDEHLDQICRLSEIEDDDHEEHKVEDMTALERKHRDANAEDFIELCRASLAFVQREESESPRPIGSSMRALCHTAIFADLLAEHRVQPPVSGAQFDDPDSPGYTYEGLTESEALEMILWRPIFEGLADGIKCSAKSQAGGVGNLVQRGSILAMRAILLRHGRIFTLNQLSAILEQTIIPAIQIAVENDVSPVVSITSESPTVSSLDFLVDPMPLPPPENDDGLKKFEDVAQQNGFAPSRGFGPAELLVEASFTDMRHGGDGNLGKAYKFAKRDMKVDMKGEQPFPNSWIATTAPVALGFLTDISSEILLDYGESGRELVWPSIGDIYFLWSNGGPSGSKWRPCEAVVRIACNEVSRFSTRLSQRLESMGPGEAIAWTNYFCQFYTDMLSKSLDLESIVEKELLDTKLASFQAPSSDAQEPSASSTDDEAQREKISTPYGAGYVEETRVAQYSQSGGDEVEINVDIVSLNYGTLYRPKTRQGETSSVQVKGTEEGKATEAGDRSAWVKMVPSLKIRCIAAHSLQLALFGSKEEMIPLMNEEEITELLQVLNRSRRIADAAVKNEDLAHAFKEAMFDWDDEEEMPEEALVNLRKLSNTQGSAMFFLTQTAGATNAVIRVLRALYQRKGESLHGVSWDRESFAERYLLELMQDVLHKFVESERKEGHLIDPNVWRTASESGGKVAVYCTSFAVVVVDILKAIIAFQPDQFERHSHTIFPLLCSLIPSHMDEIRNLVKELMLEKFSPILLSSQVSASSSSLM